MAHPLSLQTRSLLAAGIALAAFLGLAFFALDKAFFDAALSSQRERLQGYLHAYLAGADTNRAGNLIPPEVGPDPRFDRPESGLYASIVGDHIRNASDRQWRSPSALGLDLPFGTELESGANEFSGPIKTPYGELFMLSQGISWTVDDRPELKLTVNIAENASALQNQVTAFRRTLLAWLGGLGVFSSCCCWACCAGAWRHCAKLRRILPASSVATRNDWAKATRVSCPAWPRISIPSSIPSASASNATATPWPISPTA